MSVNPHFATELDFHVPPGSLRDRDQIEFDRQQRERLGIRPVGPHELPGPRITPRRRWFR